MTAQPNSSWRRSWLALVLVASATAAACADTPSDTGIGTQQVSGPRDTIPGTGQLQELQQKRAAWLARGIKDYRVQLRITCFCGSDITRPVLVEVRNGAVSNVWDLETTKPVANTSRYPTITALFDAAIAERSRGGFVAVTYDRALGIPVWLEVGTLANDAGTGYQLSGLIQI